MRIIIKFPAVLKSIVLHIYRFFIFWMDIIKYHLMNKSREFPIRLIKMRPIYMDIYKKAGGIDGHYFFQDIYFARMVIKENPPIHYDIGSRVEGFISHLLAGMNNKVVMIDIRPLSVNIEGLDFMREDAMKLDGIEDNSISSLSALHAVEHFGLGRYGDPINPDGWKDALLAIQRKIALGGVFYFSVPVGPKNVLCFNAHRIFCPQTIVDVLNELELISFAYIHDCVITEVSLEEFKYVNEKLTEYDCGLFVFAKNY